MKDKSKQKLIHWLMLSYQHIFLNNDGKKKELLAY